MDRRNIRMCRIVGGRGCRVRHASKVILHESKTASLTAARLFRRFTTVVDRAERAK
jgi:hypothetical protein